MNLVTGEICEIYVEEGTTMAKVSVKGAFIHVPILFLSQARVGDSVLIESGVAISKLEEVSKEEA